MKKLNQDKSGTRRSQKTARIQCDAMRGNYGSTNRAPPVPYRASPSAAVPRALFQQHRARMQIVAQRHREKQQHQRAHHRRPFADGVAPACARCSRIQHPRHVPSAPSAISTHTKLRNSSIIPVSLSGRDSPPPYASMRYGSRDPLVRPFSRRPKLLTQSVMIRFVPAPPTLPAGPDSPLFSTFPNFTYKSTCLQPKRRSLLPFCCLPRTHLRRRVPHRFAPFLLNCAMRTRRNQHSRQRRRPAFGRRPKPPIAEWVAAPVRGGIPQRLLMSYINFGHHRPSAFRRKWRRTYTPRIATQTSTAPPTTSHSGRSGYTIASRTRTRNGPCAGSMPARASSHVSATVSGHGGQGTNSMTIA